MRLRRRATEPARHRQQAHARGGRSATAALSESLSRLHVHVDDRLHFGVGRATKVDSLTVQWPDGRSQTLTNIAVDREIVVRQSDAKEKSRGLDAVACEPSHIHPAGRRTCADLQAADDRPRRLRRPAASSVLLCLDTALSLAVGDVNGDGLDDVFIGGGTGVAGKLFIQQKDGSFVESQNGQPWEADKDFEDWGAAFFDANGDGRPDLYVASGGYQLAPESPKLQDRLYINTGGGRFVRDPSALPQMSPARDPCAPGISTATASPTSSSAAA